MEKIKKIVLLKEYNKNYGKPPVALLGNITVVSKSWYRILKILPDCNVKKCLYFLGTVIRMIYISSSTITILKERTRVTGCGKMIYYKFLDSKRKLSLPESE